jgi:hypothetical protein
MMYENSEFTEETVWEQLRFMAHICFAVLAVVGGILAVAI